MSRIYCEERGCHETVNLLPGEAPPDGWAVAPGMGVGGKEGVTQLYRCPVHSGYLPEGSHPGKAVCGVCGVEKTGDIPETQDQAWQRVSFTGPGKPSGADGQWLCPEHKIRKRDLPKQEPRMSDYSAVLRGALEDGEDGLPFENPASHPAAIRMLCARLDALQAGFESHGLANDLLGATRTEAERQLMAEEFEAEERQEFIDEQAQILFGAGAAHYVAPTTPFTGRGKEAVATIALRSYEVAEILWAVRQKRLDAERPRAGRIASGHIEIDDEPISEGPDALVRVNGKPFRCRECGGNVFRQIRRSNPPSSDGRAPPALRYACNGCDTLYIAEGAEPIEGQPDYYQIKGGKLDGTH